jgi:DNA-binding HxlR family transcriptional regulator
VGALEKRSADGARNAVATALTPAGEEMVAVSQILEDWLLRCPKGPMGIDDGHVKVAVKALAEGWSSTLMRALALAPRSLTELSTLIPEVSYPSLERRISWMRASGQIEALPKEPRGTPYAPTDWLRRSIAPLCVAGRCERRHFRDAPPITDVEIEAAFLMTLPLVRLPRGSQGGCLLASRTDAAAGVGEEPALAGVSVEVGAGEKVSGSIDLHGDPATWAIGSSDVWLDAVIDGSIEDLRIGGAEPQLACDLVQGLHFALFIDR